MSNVYTLQKKPRFQVRLLPCGKWHYTAQCIYGSRYVFMLYHNNLLKVVHETNKKTN